MGGRAGGGARGGGSSSLGRAQQSAIGRFTAIGWTKDEATAHVTGNWNAAKIMAQIKYNTLRPTNQQIADTFAANSSVQKGLVSPWNNQKPFTSKQELGWAKQQIKFK